MERRETNTFYVDAIFLKSGRVGLGRWVYSTIEGTCKKTLRSIYTCDLHPLYISAVVHPNWTNMLAAPITELSCLFCLHWRIYPLQSFTQGHNSREWYNYWDYSLGKMRVKTPRWRSKAKCGIMNMWSPFLDASFYLQRLQWSKSKYCTYTAIDIHCIAIPLVLLVPLPPLATPLM